jgi:hypothetical protein
MADRSFADALFDQAKAHQECYIAGVKSADESGPSARKLAVLIASVEAAIKSSGLAHPMAQYESASYHLITDLRIALDVARKR